VKLEKQIEEQKENIKDEFSSLIKEEPFFLVYLIIREKGKLEFRLKIGGLLVNVLIDKLRDKLGKRLK